MPPKTAPRARRASKTTAATTRASAGNASELMPPPPIPVSSPEKSAVSSGTAATPVSAPQIPDPMMSKILGPEVRALRECLIGSGIALAQIVNHYSDVKKLGAQRHAPYPPRHLVSSWSRGVERYNDILDSMEVQVRKAIAILDAEIQAEKEREKQKEAWVIIQKGEALSHDTKQTTDSMEVDTVEAEAVAGVVVKTEPQEGDMPLSEDLISTDPTKVTFPLGVVPSGAAVPAGPRRAGSISLAPLNRSNRPSFGLKLDLSSASLRALPSLDGSTVLDGTKVDGVAQGGAGTSFVDASMASPVTLAPKSAHPRAGDELFDLTQLDLMAAVQAEQDQIAMNEISELAAAAEIAGIVGDGTAENPLEIDQDLFGEGAGGGMDLGLDTNPGASNNETGHRSAVDVDSLFSAAPDKSDPLFSPADGVIAGAPEIKKENADSTTASDFFAALGIPSASADSSAQPPQKEESATTPGKEETKPAEPLLPATSSDTDLSALDFDPLKALGVPSTSGIQQPFTAASGLVSTLPDGGATPNDVVRQQLHQLALQRQQRLARAYSASNSGTGSTPGFNLGINPNARNPQLTPGATSLGAFNGMGMASGGIGGSNAQVNKMIAGLRRQHLELARRQQLSQQMLGPGQQQQQHHMLPGGMLGMASAGLGPGGLGGGGGDPGAVGNFGMNFGIGGAGGVGSGPNASGSATLGGFSSMDAFGSLDNLLGTGNAGGSFAMPGQFGQKNQQK